MVDKKIFTEDLLKFLKDVLNLCNGNFEELNYDDEKFPVFYSDGKYKKAVKMLEKVLDETPKNTGALYYKGRSLEYLGQKEAGIKLIKKAAGFDDREAIKYLAK